MLGEVAGDVVISTQVLGEWYVNATRKLRPPVSRSDAARQIEHLLTLPVAPIDAATVRRALALVGEYPISYWDALIVVTAAENACERLLTEDLADGDTILGVRVENPIRTAADRDAPPV